MHSLLGRVLSHGLFFICLVVYYYAHLAGETRATIAQSKRVRCLSVGGGVVETLQDIGSLCGPEPKETG